MDKTEQSAANPTGRGPSETDGSAAPVSPDSASRVSCDCCNRVIAPTEERHKCQDCPDFDYCAKCAVSAPRIHPGHTFEILGPDLGSDQNTNTAPALTADEDEDPSSPVSNSPGQRECPSCALITKFLPALPLGMKDGSDTNDSQPARESALRLPLRISRLVQATQSGCAFCACILNKFFGPSNGITFGYHPEKPWYAEPCKPEHDDERKEVVDYCMETLKQIRSDRFQFCVTAKCSRKGRSIPDVDMLRIHIVSLEGHSQAERRRAFNSSGVLELVVPVFCTDDSPAATHMSSRVPNPNPQSPSGLNRAASWLEECENNHGSKCGVPGPVPLPSRVLDLSGSKIRLRETTDGETGKYAALSYRWGGPQDFQTTLGTLQRKLSGFSHESLPATLQDAVTITRKLGMRYLWVDSECIIQDCEVDKARQVSMMSSIYRNAHVTICAGHSENADAGIFTNVSDPDTGLWPNLVPMNYCLANQKAESIKDALQMPSEKTSTIWLLDEDRSLSTTHLDELARRGWCLQEHLLSPRVLYYGRWAQWRCSCTTESDGGFYAENEFGPEERRLTDALLRLPAGSADLHMTVLLQRGWYRLVNDFTQRKLGLASDRLPAIGGVATAIHRITGAEYLAGLWRDNLLHDMLWYADTRDWLCRPDVWRAPTWSWASVEAPVVYDHFSDDAMPVAVVHGCQATPAPEHNAFGEITAGTLEISGPFAELRREDVLALFKRQNRSPPPPKSNNVTEWYMQNLRHMANQPEKRVTMEEAEAALPDRVFGLLAFIRDWRRVHEETIAETCYFGLLLREVEGGKFERIGAFVNEAATWLDQTTKPWDTRKIVLV